MIGLVWSVATATVRVCVLVDGSGKLVGVRFRLGKRMRKQDVIDIDVCEQLSKCCRC